MDIGIWILFTVAAGVVAAVAWCKRRARRRVFSADHLRLELHDASVVDDRVVNAIWRAAISMENRSRRPRKVRMFAERATVTAGRRAYLATVYLDADVSEINPDDVALAWVEFVLPAGTSLRHVELLQLDAEGRGQRLRLAETRASPGGEAQLVR